MKILKIWTTFQIELKYHDHYLADEMKNYGIETTFMASDKINKEYFPYLKNTNITAGEDNYNSSRILRLKSIEFGRKQFIVDIMKMYKELCKREYQIIHIFGIANPISMLTLFILRVCRSKTPVMINDHSNPNLKNVSLIGKFYYLINAFLFSILKGNTKFIITPNLASNNLMKNRYSLNEENLKIIPLGYDSNVFNFNKKKKNSSKKYIIGFAGKVVSGKRLELLIDVLSEINDDNIICEIVGFNEVKTEYQKNLIKYAKETNVNIIFKPLINKAKDLAEFYNYIDIAIFPGSISITTIEANGCGTPIILYKSIDGLVDRVQDGRGELFEHKNELKNYILKYKKMKELDSINNLKIEKNTLKYSWKEISLIYMDLYKELIK